MRYQKVEIITQIASRCQGFAADDHIENETYEVLLTPEREEQLLPLVTRAATLTRTRLEQICNEWLRTHPDKKECCCEGEEFIGTTTIYSATYDGTSYYLANYDELLVAIQKVIDDYAA